MLNLKLSYEQMLFGNKIMKLRYFVIIFEKF